MRAGEADNTDGDNLIGRRTAATVEPSLYTLRRATASIRRLPTAMLDWL